jgi:hypothetical protein
MSATETATLLYEHTLSVTSVTEYGVSLAALASGQVPPPPEGARFDVAFEGPASGPRIAGIVKGKDYVSVRADGRFDLHIHAEITTEDGAQVALFADGVALPRPGGGPIFELRENVSLFTSMPGYTWVNPLQIWGDGTVDLATQVIHIKGSSAS